MVTRITDLNICFQQHFYLWSLFWFSFYNECWIQTLSNLEGYLYLYCTPPRESHLIVLSNKAKSSIYRQNENWNCQFPAHNQVFHKWAYKNKWPVVNDHLLMTTKMHALRLYNSSGLYYNFINNLLSVVVEKRSLNDINCSGYRL